MNRMKTFIICISFLGAVVQSYGQLLTLDQAVNTALKNSLGIEIAQNLVEANEVQNDLSVAGGMPVVTGNLNNNQSLSRLNQKLSNGTTTNRGNANTVLNANVEGRLLLYNGLRVKATKKRLEAIERQSEEVVVAQIQNLIANVMFKYYDVVRQHRYIETIKQSIEVTLQRRNIIDVRQSVGLANNADSYQAQLDLNASQQELRNQELVLEQAKSDLLNLMTQRPDSVYVISDTIMVDSTINFLKVKENISRNPDLLAAEQQIIINELMVREVGAQRYPSISLNTGVNYTRSQNAAGFTLLNQSTGPYIGLSVGVPIFNGGIFKKQQKAAEYYAENAELNRSMLKNDLYTQAEKAWQAYRNTLSRLQKEKENNRVAEALLQLTQKRFELSAATIIEVREAQRSFEEAGYRLVNLSYSAKVAEIELKRLSRQLGK